MYKFKNRKLRISLEPFFYKPSAVSDNVVSAKSSAVTPLNCVVIFANSVSMFNDVEPLVCVVAVGVI